MNVRVYDDPEALAQAACDLILLHLRAGRRRLLLAGGSTPRRTYQLVAERGSASEWKGTELFFGDERMVTPDHADSNYGMVRAAWLAPAHFPTERVHRIAGELPSADRAARLAEEDLLAVTGSPPRIDLALLGLGPDGHTASLFPGDPDLEPDTDRLYAPARGGTRVTATVPLLNACGLVVFLVSGAAKADAVHSALHDPPGTVPASLIAPAAPPLFLLDRPAAARLSR